MRKSAKSRHPTHHQKSLHEFYTEEQKHQEHQHEQQRKHREEVERIEQEIFEHLKQHTKKILNQKK